MNIREVVDEIPLFAQAQPASKAKILSYASSKKYQKGEYLFHIRDQVKQVYLVVSGYAVLERVNRNDMRKAIFLLPKGSLLNEVVLEKQQSSVNCYALSDLEVVSMTVAQYLEIMESDFGFTRMVMESMCQKIRRLYHQVETTTKTTKLEMQVASRIWKFTRDFGIQKSDGLELPFRLTITFLAELVGSNRETVSRIIKEFSDAGILTIVRGTCKVHDMKKLKEIFRVS